MMLDQCLILKKDKKAMDLTLSGEVVKMDICQANNKYFAYVVGAGKFIDISYVTPHKLKKIRQSCIFSLWSKRIKF